MWHVVVRVWPFTNILNRCYDMVSEPSEQSSTRNSIHIWNGMLEIQQNDPRTGDVDNVALDRIRYPSGLERLRAEHLI